MLLVWITRCDIFGSVISGFISMDEQSSLNFDFLSFLYGPGFAMSLFTISELTSVLCK